MAVALELAGQTEVPPDSGIDVPASHVRKALFGIDADGSDLLIAMQLGYDLLINHHPTGGESQVRFPLVLTNLAGDGASAAIRDATGQLTRRFYRVVAQ